MKLKCDKIIGTTRMGFDLAMNIITIGQCFVELKLNIIW